MSIKKGDLVLIGDCEKDYQKVVEDFHNIWKFKDDDGRRSHRTITSFGSPTMATDAKVREYYKEKMEISAFKEAHLIINSGKVVHQTKYRTRVYSATTKPYSKQAIGRIARLNYHYHYGLAVYDGNEMQRASHKLSKNKFFNLRNTELNNKEFRNNRFIGFILEVKKEKQRTLDLIKMVESDGTIRYCRRGIIEKFIISKPA